MKRQIGKTVTVYRPKSLVDGGIIGRESGKQYVAVPDKFAGHPFAIIYGGAQMNVRDWKAESVVFRRFRDKYWTEGNGRSQYYTLGYIRFNPEVI